MQYFCLPFRIEKIRQIKCPPFLFAKNVLTVKLWKGLFCSTALSNRWLEVHTDFASFFILSFWILRNVNRVIFRSIGSYNQWLLLIGQFCILLMNSNKLQLLLSLWFQLGSSITLLNDDDMRQGSKLASGSA